jgi:hypothetical protein
MNYTFKNLLLVVITLAFFSCKKDKDDDSTPTVAPKLTIEIGHFAGTQKFYFDSVYTTANGDDISVTMFKYYLSNIVLVRSDNTEYAVPNSYFLVNHDVESSMLLEMSNLPAGEFNAIRFLVGVDSTRNVSGAQTGALDPGNAMFWDWNSGYIFMKVEGTSPSVPASDFVFHIGGFEGAQSCIREISFDFNGDLLHLANNKQPELHFKTNILEVFANPNTIDLSVTNQVQTTGAAAVSIADNYADFITYDHMHDE